MGKHRSASLALAPLAVFLGGFVFFLAKWLVLAAICSGEAAQGRHPRARGKGVGRGFGKYDVFLPSPSPPPRPSAAAAPGPSGPSGTQDLATRLQPKRHAVIVLDKDNPSRNTPNSESLCKTSALINRIRFWGILYQKYNKEPPKPYSNYYGPDITYHPEPS